MCLGDMTVVRPLYIYTWTLGIHFRKAPFTLYIRLARCIHLQPPSRDSEILVENWLKIVRVFIPHAYLTPPMGMITRHNFRKKTAMQSSRLTRPITMGLSQWRNRGDTLRHYFAQSTTVTDGRTKLRQRNEKISRLAKPRVEKNTRVDTIQNYYSSCRQHLNNFDRKKMSVVNKLWTKLELLWQLGLLHKA